MPSRRNILGLLLPVGSIFGIVHAACTSAAAVTFQSSLQTGLSYTDNVALAGSGQEEKETIISVAPGIGVTGRGSRAQVNLNYAVEALYYTEVPSRSYARQDLSSRAEVTLVENHAYVEGTGSIRRQEIDRTASVGAGSLTTSDAVGEVSTWTLLPYFVQQFGGVAVARASLGLDYVDYQRDANDSFGREYLFSIRNGPSASKFTWGTEARTKRVFIGGGGIDYSIIQYDVSLGYQFSQEWALEGSAGYLKYNYAADVLNTNQTRGNQWRAGVRWAPSPRTEVAFGVGEQLFGSLWNCRLSNRTRSIYSELSYDEQVTTNRDIQITDSQSVQDPASTQQTASGDIVRSESDQVFVSERSRFLVRYASAKVESGVEFANEHRRFELRASDETIYGGLASIRWAFSARAAGRVSYEQRVVRDANGMNDKVGSTTYAVDKKISAKTDLSAEIKRVARNSDSATATDYIEHEATVRVRSTF